MGAVELVVGGHHAQRLCLFDHRFKGGKIDLVQGALVHHAVADHPVGLLIVGGKMLDAAAHTIALDAVDQCRAHLTAEIGVFAEILKVASAQRAALDVQTGAKQQGQILGAALVAQRFAQLFCQSGVKAGSHRRTGRETDRRDAFVDAQMVALLVLFAQTAGAVAHHHGGHTEPLHRLCVPEIRTGAEVGFFLQRHLLDDLFNIHSVMPSFRLRAVRSPLIFLPKV